MKETLATIVAGVVLATAATAGLVATQASAEDPSGLPEGGTVVTYEQGE